MFIRSATCLFLLFAIVSAGSDSGSHRFGIGYEQGISFRVIPSPSLGLGLVIKPVDYGFLYQESRNENRDQYDSSSHSGNSHGVSIMIEALHPRKIGNHFSLTLFASAGGGYEKSRYTRDYFSQQPRYNYDTRSITISVIGQTGVMPGFHYGPFSIQFRIGIGGSVRKIDSPAESSRQSSGSSKVLYPVYPGDLVRALIVHFSF